MHPHVSEPRPRRLRTVITIVVTTLVVAPATALASHSFSDVANGDFSHEGVDWMKETGVTVGCNPPDNTKYCPDDFVTRGQMAVFLERLDTKDVFLRPGEVSLDGGDADTLDGKDSSAFLGAKAKAADANKLDGKDSTAFLGATATATNADKLDGLDSTDLATDLELASELADLAAFLPVATFTVIDGGIEHAEFRDPITGTPTVFEGSDGFFAIELPGLFFTVADDTEFGHIADVAVCTAAMHNLTIAVSEYGGLVGINLWEADGTRADSADDEDDFTCAVYAN